MIKTNPFTPKSGWEPKVFAGRADEFHFFEKKLQEAKNRLRGCDAVYVAVAYLFNVKLITLDEQQKERSKGLIEAMTPMEEIV
ncbi:MAG: hypothetical protein KAU14_03965 [Thermoplasmata archaeon]|nr:hypothetical protein [Thermoplasmata archaeon]